MRKRDFTVDQIRDAIEVSLLVVLFTVCLLGASFPAV